MAIAYHIESCMAERLTLQMTSDRSFDDGKTKVNYVQLKVEFRRNETDNH